jgi:hypothetical protein
MELITTYGLVLPIPYLFPVNIVMHASIKSLAGCLKKQIILD